MLLLTFLALQAMLKHVVMTRNSDWAGQSVMSVLASAFRLLRLDHLDVQFVRVTTAERRFVE